jgi:hypothetical protein
VFRTAKVAKLADSPAARAQWDRATGCNRFGEAAPANRRGSALSRLSSHPQPSGWLESRDSQDFTWEGGITPSRNPAGVRPDCRNARRRCKGTNPFGTAFAGYVRDNSPC